MIPYAGKNRRTVNYLKAMYFDCPDWVPCDVSLMPATWIKHREALEDIVLAHPRLFPGYTRGARDFDAIDNPLYEPGLHRDSWGSVWRNVQRGLAGIVVEEPLDDWAKFAQWRPPAPFEDDLFGPRRDWAEVKRDLDRAKDDGELASGGLPHGFMFMRLYYLRGFENLMMDMATGEKRLCKLISIVERHNAAIVARFLDLGAEYITAGDDLGMQKALPISPAMWRKFVKPSYEAIFGQCRDSGIPVFLHSDGHILEIIPDLVETGVTVINPQIGANALESLRETAMGKVAIRLDLDRQLFPFATPSQIEDHIGEAFDALYMREGGLMFVAEMEPDVPLENIQAACAFLERICDLPAPEALM